MELLTVPSPLYLGSARKSSILGVPVQCAHLLLTGIRWRDVCAPLLSILWVVPDEVVAVGHLKELQGCADCMWRVLSLVLSCSLLYEPF